MILEKLKAKIRVLPNKPGVYQYYDAEGVILYVGKAKDLKKRVASYFNKNLDSGKTRILVRQIVEIKYIVVDTELDDKLLYALFNLQCNNNFVIRIGKNN